MNTLGVGFVVGVVAILVYKSNIIHIINNSMHNGGQSSKTISLLRINLSEVEENFDKMAMEIVSDFENIGFASVYGVKDYDEDELFKWTKWFFDLPLQTKMAVAKKAFNTSSPAIYRGYYPIVPGTHSFKEAFEMGIFNQENPSRGIPLAKDIRNITTDKNGRPYMRNLFAEKNIFPVTENAAEDIMFTKVMQKYFRIYKNVGDTILSLMATGLGFKRTAFDYLFGEQMAGTFRLLHYPTRLTNPADIPESAWDGKTAIVTGEHFDTTMLTILSTFNNSGLQIKPPGYTSWVDVPPTKNAFVINIGALLVSMVEDKMIATNHRVIDIGSDRYSVPFFYEPSFDADVGKTYYGKKNHFVGKYTKYGPWCANRTSQFYEYATTDFGILD